MFSAICCLIYVSRSCVHRYFLRIYLAVPLPRLDICSTRVLIINVEFTCNMLAINLAWAEE